VQQLCRRVSASPKTWRKFLDEAMEQSARHRESALREFLRRRCPEDGMGPAYLLRMIREGAGNPQPEPEVVDTRTAWERAGFKTYEEWDADAIERTKEVLAT